MKQWIFFAGTSLAYENKGVYRIVLDADTGRFLEHSFVLDAPDSKYLAIGGRYLAAAFQQDGAAGVILARMEVDRPVLTCRQIEGRVAPCYVAFWGNRLVSVNYHEGTVHIYRCDHEQLLLEKKIIIDEKAGCHQALAFYGRMLVPCLEQDCIRLFFVSGDDFAAGEILFPPGCGPRHGVFDRSLERFWAVGERDNRLYSFRVRRDQTFLLESTRRILPENAAEGSLTAAIRLSPDERFLTVSTRGADLLTTWRTDTETTEPVQQVSSGGTHPRDFLITPDGKFLLAANRDSGDVVCFKRDSQNGLIGAQTDKLIRMGTVSLVTWKEHIQ